MSLQHQVNVVHTCQYFINCNVLCDRLLTN